MAQELAVWMNGQYVGLWSKSAKNISTFQYAESWIESEYVRPLSNSMPINPQDGLVRGEVVSNYFDNLLPDSAEIRSRIQAKFRTKNTDAYELLTAIGRDCVGAVQMLPLGEEPVGFDKINSRRLSDKEVAEVLIAASTGRVLGQEFDEDFFRISISGAQEKTALLRYQNSWHWPLQSTPTTHILKLPLGLIGGEKRMDMTTSIENEWLCSKIFEKLGFDVAKTEIAVFEGLKALVVERFDREWMDGDSWIARVPQEDFCQVFGLPSSRKYESDGGPGIFEIVKYLAGSDNKNNNLQQFLASQFVFWLMAATDGHAKNFSVRINAGGGYEMTPLYDNLSAWPVIGSGANKLQFKKAKLAMAIRTSNTHYKIDEIHTRHWREVCRKTGLEDVFDLMVGISKDITHVIEDIRSELPITFPMHLFDAIAKGVRKQVGRFEAGMSLSKKR